jgi:hypothetical protein
MAQIVVQNITGSGGLITYQPAAEGGDFFSNDGPNPEGEVVLFVIGPNDGYTVIVKNFRPCDYGIHPDYSIVVPAGSIAAMSPRFSQQRFNEHNEDVRIEYSNADGNAVGIQVAAVRIDSVFQDT